MATNTTLSTQQGPNQAHENGPSYSQRAQWLRAAVLGANDGLVSTTSLMMGVGAVKDDARAMVVTGLAGLVAGACSMAIGEFVSVHSQLDIELAQKERENKFNNNNNQDESNSNTNDELPRPLQAAAASGLAFSVGSVVPLMAAGFIGRHDVRLGVVAAASSMGLVCFGSIGALVGRAPVGRSGLRVLVGGWVAMAVTFGLVKLFGFSGL